MREKELEIARDLIALYRDFAIPFPELDNTTRQVMLNFPSHFISILDRRVESLDFGVLSSVQKSAYFKFQFGVLRFEL